MCVHISGLSLERYCARIVFARLRSAASLSIVASPSMSLSLSLTPSVETDRPVTPNDFLMSSACQGSVSQVMPSAIHSTILPSTRMLCTQLWYPEGPRIPRFVQFLEEPSDIDDVAERNKVVSMYPYTELLLQMSVDARRRSARTNPIAIITSQIAYGRVHRIRNSYLRNSWTQAPCPFLFRPSCLPWSWQGRRHPWASLLTHARFLEGTFSIVSLCFSGESMDEACTAR